MPRDFHKKTEEENQIGQSIPTLEIQKDSIIQEASDCLASNESVAMPSDTVLLKAHETN